MRISRRQIGFTLVELMITLIVAAILLAMAIPSFIESRQRSALRGAADQVQSFWADARFEALRRNSFVAVTMRGNADGRMCLGANTVATATTTTACDCFTAGACNVSSYPGTQSSWRLVRMQANPTLGPNDADLVGVAVVDPKRGGLGDENQAGTYFLQSPEGGRSDYRLSVAIDRNGRAFVCEPSAAPDKLPQFTNKRC